MKLYKKSKDKLKYPIKILHFLGFLKNEKNIFQKIGLYTYVIGIMITTVQVIIQSKVAEINFEAFVGILDATVAIFSVCIIQFDDLIQKTVSIFSL